MAGEPKWGRGEGHRRWSRRHWGRGWGSRSRSWQRWGGVFMAKPQHTVMLELSGGAVLRRVGHELHGLIVSDGASQCTQA